MADSQTLTGITVVVTRPTKQAGPLCRLIEAKGGQTIPFPTLEILEPQHAKELTSIQKRLDQFDLAIFVSVNAVEGAARLIGAKLPSHLKLATVGNSTRKVVEQQWHQPVICPDQGANSEALLATTELQHIEGHKIVIFRGQGGRELLAQTLSQRGAAVEYAEVYRRAKPNANPSELISHQPSVDLITATSNETLQNLYDMADAEQRDWLLSRQLIVISERTALLAKQLGFRLPAIVARESNDQGLVNAMLTWRTHNKTTINDFED